MPTGKNTRTAISVTMPVTPPPATPVSLHRNSPPKTSKTTASQTSKYRWRRLRRKANSSRVIRRAMRTAAVGTGTANKGEGAPQYNAVSFSSNKSISMRLKSRKSLQSENKNSGSKNRAQCDNNSSSSSTCQISPPVVLTNSRASNSSPSTATPRATWTNSTASMSSPSPVSRWPASKTSATKKTMAQANMAHPSPLRRAGLRNR